MENISFVSLIWPNPVNPLWNISSNINLPLTILYSPSLSCKIYFVSPLIVSPYSPVPYKDIRYDKSMTTSYFTLLPISRPTLRYPSVFSLELPGNCVTTSKKTYRSQVGRGTSLLPTHFLTNIGRFEKEILETGPEWRSGNRTRVTKVSLQFERN